MKRVLFMGGKAVGEGVLEHLTRNANVVGVIANNSVSKMQLADPIRELREATVFDDINSDDSLAWMANLYPDYIVVAYYDQILGRDVLEIPRMGAVNVHMGLIQEYRGCYPTTWPIVDGKDHAGVTVHYMTEGIDDGGVIAQSEMSLTGSETGREVYDRLVELAIETFEYAWERLRRGIVRSKSVLNLGAYRNRKSFPSHNLTELADDELLRMVRALTFPPFQKPYFEIGGRRYVITLDE